jgi:hypothetical protein
LQTRKFRKKFEIKSGFVQKSTEEAHVQSDRCKCKNCIARSELHNKKINFMLNTEYICNEASRFHPKYIEFMEADYNENQQERSAEEKQKQSERKEKRKKETENKNRERRSTEEKEKQSEKEKKRKEKTENKKQDRRLVGGKRKRNERKEKSGTEKKRKEVTDEQREAKMTAIDVTVVTPTSKELPLEQLPESSSFNDGLPIAQTASECNAKPLLCDPKNSTIHCT